MEDGCTYIAAYDSGSFDELYNSLGISNWLSTAPPSILAQVRELPIKFFSQEMCVILQAGYIERHLPMSSKVLVTKHAMKTTR